MHEVFQMLGDVELEGFVTKDQFAHGEAQRRRFRPMPAGTAWGAKWEYAWFKGSFALPPEPVQTARRLTAERPEPGQRGPLAVSYCRFIE